MTQVGLKALGRKWRWVVRSSQHGWIFVKTQNSSRSFVCNKLDLQKLWSVCEFIVVRTKISDGGILSPKWYLNMLPTKGHLFFFSPAFWPSPTQSWGYGWLLVLSNTWVVGEWFLAAALHLAFFSLKLEWQQELSQQEAAEMKCLF